MSHDSCFAAGNSFLSLVSCLLSHLESFLGAGFLAAGFLAGAGFFTSDAFFTGAAFTSLADFAVDFFSGFAFSRD